MNSVSLFPMPGQNGLVGAYVGMVVRDAISPFKTGQVTVSTNAEMDPSTVIFRVDVDAVSNHPFVKKIDRSAFDLHPPREMMVALYDELFNHYRYRPTLPIEEHIQLGED